MRKMVAVVVALLVLTGCSATEPVDVEGALENIESKDEQTADAQPAPLEAEQPETAATPDDPEEAFIQAVRAVIDPETTQIPNATDEQLLLAAEEACAQIADGVLPDQVRVIKDEEPNQLGFYIDSQAIGVRAEQHLC